MTIPQITVRFNAPTASDTTENIEAKSYDTFAKLNPFASQLNAYSNAIHTTVRSITVETAIDYRDEMRQIRDDARNAKNQAQEIALGGADNYFYSLIVGMAQQDLLNLNLQIKFLKMEKENASSN